MKFTIPQLRLLNESDEDLRRSERAAQGGDVEALSKAFRTRQRLNPSSEFEGGSVGKQIEKLQKLGGTPRSDDVDEYNENDERHELYDSSKGDLVDEVLDLRAENRELRAKLRSEGIV